MSVIRNNIVSLRLFATSITLRNEVLESILLSKICDPLMMIFWKVAYASNKKAYTTNQQNESWGIKLKKLKW